MAHRAKHLRRNWIPERRKKADERAEDEYQRQYAAALKREQHAEIMHSGAGAEAQPVEGPGWSQLTELEPGS